MSTSTKPRTRTSHTPVVCRQIAAAFKRGESLQDLGRTYNLGEKDLAKLIYDTLSQPAEASSIPDRGASVPTAAEIVDVVSVDATGMYSVLLTDGRVWVTRSWDGSAGPKGIRHASRKRTDLLSVNADGTFVWLLEPFAKDYAPAAALTNDTSKKPKGWFALTDQERTERLRQALTVGMRRRQETTRSIRGLKTPHSGVLVFRRPDMVYETHLGDGPPHLSVVPFTHSEIRRLRHDECVEDQRSVANYTLRNAVLQLIEQESDPELDCKHQFGMKTIADAVGGNDSGLRRSLGISVPASSIKTSKKGIRRRWVRTRATQVIEVEMAERLAAYLHIQPNELGL